MKENSADAVMTPFAHALKRRKELITELIDFRKMLEPPLAARAATHASAKQIAEMEDTLRRQKEKQNQGESAVDEDTEFHYGVALAAENSVALKVIDILMEQLRDTRARSLQVAGRPRKSLTGHQRILAAIKRRDSEAAKGAMVRHLEDVEEIVLSRFSLL